MTSIASLDTLPPHLLLDVLERFIEDGGNLYNICSSSNTLAQRCKSIKAPLVQALVRRGVNLLKEPYDIKERYEYAASLITHSSYILEKCLQSNEIPQSHKQKLLVDASRHGNLQLLDFLLARIRVDRGNDDRKLWVIVAIRLIVEAHYHQLDDRLNYGWMIYMVKRLIYICKKEFHLTSDQILQNSLLEDIPDDETPNPPNLGYQFLDEMLD